MAEKVILAWIMKSCLAEYADCTVNEIAEKYIEEKPQVAQIPVAPDERQNTSVIQGTGVEDTTITEGTVTFDIRFHAAVPVSREQIGLMINIEAQNQFYPGYPLTKRGIYYCCRMISSQYGTVFTGSHYEKLKKVYSVWICMDPPKSRENTITRYFIQEGNLIGRVREPVKNYDLLSVLLLCPGDPESSGSEGILKLLGVLLSSEIKANDKKKLLEQEFYIEMNRTMEREVEQMCNLSQGVEQRGIQKGIQRGIQKGIQEGMKKGIFESIQNLMDTMNWSAKDAMDALRIKEEDRFQYIELLNDRNRDSQ